MDIEKTKSADSSNRQFNAFQRCRLLEFDKTLHERDILEAHRCPDALFLGLNILEIF